MGPVPRLHGRARIAGVTYQLLWSRRGGIPWSVTFGQSGDVAVQAVAAPGRVAHPEAYVEYYSLDAIGSLRAVTGELGTVLRRHDFLPFGEEWQPPVPSGETRLFTGQERDAETGLDYFGARYYRQDLARFTTIDPLMVVGANLADPQRWNRYAYARNNRVLPASLRELT